MLAQARRADVPLLERLRYVCIVSSNMDEFFEVRFADYLEAARQRRRRRLARATWQSVAAEAHALIDDQYAVFNDEVMPALQREGIVILNHAERNEAQRALGRRASSSARCGRCWCRWGWTRRTRFRRWPTSR